MQSGQKFWDSLEVLRDRLGTVLEIDVPGTVENDSYFKKNMHDKLRYAIDKCFLH